MTRFEFHQYLLSLSDAAFVEVHQAAWRAYQMDESNEIARLGWNMVEYARRDRAERREINESRRQERDGLR